VATSRHRNPVCILTRGGHAHFFFQSAIATPELEGSTSAIAIPQLFKEMLLRNRNSSMAIFSYVCNLKEFHFHNFWHILGHGQFMKKIGGKKSCAIVPLRQVFGFWRNR
jgi:hypothetical protein